MICLYRMTQDFVIIDKTEIFHVHRFIWNTICPLCFSSIFFAGKYRKPAHNGWCFHLAEGALIWGKAREAAPGRGRCAPPGSTPGTLSAGRPHRPTGIRDPVSNQRLSFVLCCPCETVTKELNHLFRWEGGGGQAAESGGGPGGNVFFGGSGALPWICGARGGEPPDRCPDVVDYLDCSVLVVKRCVVRGPEGTGLKMFP